MRRVFALLIAALLAFTPCLVWAQAADGSAAAAATDAGADTADTTADTTAEVAADTDADAGADTDADVAADADEGMAPVLASTPPPRDGRGDEIAMGVIAGSCFIAGAGFLVVASNRRADLDRVEGTTLYANEQRRIYEQQDEGNRMLGYSLIGVGLLASAGLAVLIHNDGPELSVSPSASRRGGGLAFGARF